MLANISLAASLRGCVRNPWPLSTNCIVCCSHEYQWRTSLLVPTLPVGASMAVIAITILMNGSQQHDFWRHTLQVTMTSSILLYNSPQPICIHASTCHSRFSGKCWISLHFFMLAVGQLGYASLPIRLFVCMCVCMSYCLNACRRWLDYVLTTALLKCCLSDDEPNLQSLFVCWWHVLPIRRRLIIHLNTLS